MSAPVLPLLVSLVQARSLPVTGFAASSSYPTEAGVSYEPANITDHRATVVWVEGASGSGLGSWVELRLGEARTITAVQIYNGHWFSPDFWKRHNRMKDVELIFSDGTKLPFKLSDKMAVETLTLPKPVTTSSVRIRFTSVYAGTTFGDTVVSEVLVLDASPDEHVVPVKATASSTYPADADGSYDPANLSDGLIDTLWCEGNKTGDGTGEWIDLDLGGQRSISKVEVRNGNATSAEDNARTSQPKEIELVFDDGAVPLTLEASAGLQSFAVGAHTSTKVRLNVRSVAPGAEFADLCLSEVRLVP